MIRIEDNLYNSSFPQLKVSLKKKDEKWQHDCVNYIIGESDVTSGGGQTKTRFGEIQTYYNLYNSIFDEKDFKRITNPFKVEDGFPATPLDFNIIRPKVDLLIGEETKRPLNFRVVRTSQEAASELQEKAKQMLLNYIMASITARMSEEEAIQFQLLLLSGEIMPPEAIAKYMNKEYKDVVENTAYHALAYLSEKLSIDNEFIKGWKDALIAGTEIYYVGINNSEPYLERVNPLFFSYDKSPDLEFIEDGSWCCRRMRMPITLIYDRYYDKLTEKDLSKLEEMMTGRPSNDMGDKDPVDDFNHINIRIYDNPMFDLKTRHAVNVWHCCWKSFKKIFYVTMLDEAGQPQIEIADESYKKTGMELSVEPDWIVEVWEGYRAGTDLYFGIQPLEYQHVSIDNPNSQKLPYTGAIYSDTNSKPRSLVSILKPLQYMYIVLWYRLELAIGRDKGKVVNMDITLIPKSMNITPDRWMHYLSSVGVNFINPYETQWGNGERAGGHCFAPGTKVIMCDGSIKNIEDIKVGDCVLGPDGRIRNVLETHSGIDHMYRIHGGSGCEDQVVNSSHLIRYKERNHFKDLDYTRLATPLELLKEDQENNYKKHLRYLERADIVENMEQFRGKCEFMLDPYLLGLWLGDGTRNKSTFTTEDIEIANYLAKWAEEHAMRLTIRKNGERNNSLLIDVVGNSKRNYLKECLRFYHILDYKDIPQQYILNSSREDRLKLLAGLIDTDGSFSKRDRIYTFSQCSDRKHLVYKAAFVARSLGFKCEVRHCKTACKKYILNSSHLSECKDTYVLRIIDGKYDIPCILPRKQHHWEKKRTVRTQSHFTVSYEGLGEYYGFSTDGDHLFLLDDFTIVHNSAAFNQISALDLTMSNVIGEYIQLMDKIELLAGTISGITEQRMGEISTRELVGNVERSVVQSSNITEPLFWTHNQCKRRALNMLLNTAKGAWEQTGKKKLSYIFDNGERAFLDIDPKFYFEDMDVFVSDTTKDVENLQKLQQLIQPAMQNGASLLEAAEVLTTDNLNLLKQKLQEMQERQEEAMRQQQEAEQQQAMQLQQMQNEQREQELMLEEAKMELERYKIDADNQTKIAVAEISAYRGTEEKDIDKNGVSDPIEIGKQALEQQKISSQEYTKRYEARQKKDIEEQKILLEKDRMKHETELQAQKDKAAMEREKIKARTALKNKTSGEK